MLLRIKVISSAKLKYVSSAEPIIYNYHLTIFSNQLLQNKYIKALCCIDSDYGRLSIYL